MKICCVFNYASHYRYPIYKAMSDSLNCDFYFGDKVETPIKKFDAFVLRGFKGYINAKLVRIGKYKFTWHSNSLNIFRSQYSHYILTGSSGYILNWLILIYAKLFRKKVFLWCHGLRQKKVGIKSIFHKLFFCSADGVFMYGQHNLSYMLDIGCKRNKIYFIHNSLNTKEQTDIYSELQPSDIYVSHFGNNNPVLIYIGRLQPQKRVEQIIEAMDVLKSYGYNLNLVVVGDIQDGGAVESMVISKKLEDQVWLYGPSYDERCNGELIYNASACVVPNYIGLTAIHSLSYGTPVITNDNFMSHGPEFEAIEEGVTGTFFKENDVNDLVKTIKEWCVIDTDKRNECRSRARQMVEKEWSVDYQIDIFKKVLLN